MDINTTKGNNLYSDKQKTLEYIQSVPYHIGLSPSFNAKIRKFITRKNLAFLQEKFYISFRHVFNDFFSD